MLTLSGAYQHIKHALGGALIEDLDPISFVNETGHKLVSMRGWNWMMRPQVFLAQVNGQEYMVLPDDFGELVTIQFSAGLTSRVLLTTFDVIGRYRAQNFAAPGYLIYAAVLYAPDSVTGVPKPRLEVYPTPTSSDPVAIKMFYRARWTDLTASDDQQIPVPPYIEPLFIQILRAVAQGYQSGDIVSMSQRLADVIGGPDWMAAVRADSNEQTNLGPMRGGGLSEHWDWGDGEWLLQNQVLPPSSL